MPIFEEILFFKATYNAKTNKSLIFCQLGSCGRKRTRVLCYQKAFFLLLLLLLLSLSLSLSVSNLLCIFGSRRQRPSLMQHRDLSRHWKQAALGSAGLGSGVGLYAVYISRSAVFHPPPGTQSCCLEPSQQTGFVYFYVKSSYQWLSHFFSSPVIREAPVFHLLFCTS